MMSRLMGAVASALLVVPVAARGADAPSAAADEEFLEYLGSWDGDDRTGSCAGRSLETCFAKPAERARRWRRDRSGRRQGAAGADEMKRRWVPIVLGALLRIGDRECAGASQ